MVHWLNDSLDETDRRVLHVLQRELALVRRPFAAIARQLDLPEADLLARVGSLRTAGVIREVSGIFDLPSLGYQQALVAFAAPPDDLDRCGGIVAHHPGVSHCYARRNQYNLWFCIATSARSRLGLDGAVNRLAGDCHARRAMILPTVRRYKLSVFFGSRPAETPDAAADGQDPPPATQPPDEQEIRAIRTLQTDLPSQPEPFVPLAAAAGLQTDTLLTMGRRFQRLGWMRRYAAVLHHRSAGARSNVLVAWVVAPQQADHAGRACAAHQAVSHCYLRPPGQEWPYTLYTMLHGPTPEACLATIDELTAHAALGDRTELWTLAEYAKRRVRLFTDEEAAWERRL